MAMTTLQLEMTTLQEKGGNPTILHNPHNQLILRPKDFSEPEDEFDFVYMNVLAVSFYNLKSSQLELSELFSGDVQDVLIDLTFLPTEFSITILKRITICVPRFGTELIDKLPL